MISFEQFLMEDGVPIYVQIVRYLKRGMIAGTIQTGDELPSRRMLSALLGVNPNTVQKACRMLEEEGLIESHAGAKSYAVVDEATVKRLKNELLKEDVRTLVAALRQTGISKEDALDLIGTMWEEEP